MINYWFHRHLAGRAAKTILDIGPGYNTFAIEAARLTHAETLYFLDYSHTILDWQMATCEKEGLKAVAIQADLNQEAAAHLPGPFDLILCQELLEHLPKADKFLTHLARHLSPEGMMVITVPTKISERLITWLNPNYMKNEPYGHVNQFDRAGMKKLLHQAGLRDEVFISIQPHYFLGHLWLFGMRVPIEDASGKILKYNWKTRIFGWLVRGSRFIFLHTFPRFWGMCFPRNYFILARRISTK